MHLTVRLGRTGASHRPLVDGAGDGANVGRRGAAQPEGSGAHQPDRLSAQSRTAGVAVFAATATDAASKGTSGEAEGHTASRRTHAAAEQGTAPVGQEAAEGGRRERGPADDAGHGLILLRLRRFRLLIIARISIAVVEAGRTCEERAAIAGLLVDRHMASAEVRSGWRGVGLDLQGCDWRDPGKVIGLREGESAPRTARSECQDREQWAAAASKYGAARGESRPFAARARDHGQRNSWPSSPRRALMSLELRRR